MLNSDGTASFDGTGYIDYGNLLQYMGSYTIRAKVRCTSNYTSRQGIVSTEDAGFSGFQLTKWDSKKLISVVQSAAPQSNTDIDDDSWFDLVEVVDFENGEVSFYLNGVDDGGATGVYSFGDTTKKLTIGARRDGVQDFWYGDMDLVEIYQGALSEEEVSLLYNDKLYSGYTKEGLILDTDFTQGHSMNLVRPDLPHDDTDVEYKKQGAYFNGATSLIDYGSNSFYQLADNLSIEVVVWAVPPMSGPTDALISTKTGTNGYGMWLQMGTLQCRIGPQFHNFGPDPTGDYDSVAQHLVVTYDGSIIKGFMNGQLDPNTQSYSGGVTAWGNLIVGNRPDSSLPAHAIIKVARIYDRALSHEEVMQNLAYARSRGWVR